MKYLYKITLLLLISISLNAQNISSSEIDSIVNKSLSKLPQAGIAVAVVKDGKVIHAKGYGLKSVNSKDKVDENSLFAIASNTKAFTSMSLAILVDRGDLNWNDKVINYIPEFTMYNEYVRDNFTIADLLTHRSGLGLGAGDLMFFPDGSDFRIQDVLNSFQYQKARSAFRTKYDYDNLLYLVAGEVVKRVSGMEWVDFVEKEIFQKLNMKDTYASYSLIQNNKNIAKPHSVKKNKVEEIGVYTKPNLSVSSAGGIYSSVADLSKWIIMHLNSGIYDDSKRLISKKTHNSLWKPYTNISFNAKAEAPYYNHYTSYGLGWFIKDHNSYTVISHTGGLPGYLSQTVLIPELNTGFVILTNSDPGGYSYKSIANILLDKITGVKDGEDWLAWAEDKIEKANSNVDDISEEVWKKAFKNSSNKIDTDKYTGIYKDPWFGKVEVYKKGNELWIRSYRSPKLTGRMYLYSKNTFAVKWNYQDMPCDAFASFVFDEKEKAQSIKMKGISPDIDFSFDFQDLDLKRIE